MLKRAMATTLLAIAAFTANAQVPLPPSDSAQFRHLVSHTGNAAATAAANSQRLGVRLRDSNGRTLLSHSDGAAWFVPDSLARGDSAIVTVSYTPNRTSGVVIMDWKRRCLTFDKRESAIPMKFASCNDPPLAVFPSPAEAFEQGAAFWLLTPVGRAGLEGSYLMPRSSGNIWLLLEPIR